MAKSRSVGLQIVIAGDPSGASRAFGVVAKDATSFTGKVKAAVGGMATLFAGRQVIQWGQAAIQAYRSVGGEVVKLERLTGLASDRAAGLWVAAQQSGVGVDKLGNAIGILSSKLNSGAVEKLGIDLRTATGEARPFEDVLRDIMDRFAAMENGPEKNLLARQLFGRSGTDLIPLLNRGGDALDEFTDKARKLGIVINDADIKKATQNQRDFSLAMKASEVVIGKELLPAATKFTTWAATNLPPVVKGVTSVAHAFGALPGPIKGVVAGLLLLGPAVKIIGALGAPFRALSTVVTGAKGSLDMFRLGMMGVTQKGAGFANAAGGWVAAVGGIGPATALAGVAVVGFGAIPYGWQQNAQNAAKRAAELKAGIASIRGEAESTGKSVDEVFRSTTLVEFFAKGEKGFDRLGINIKEFSKEIAASDDEWNKYVDSIIAANDLDPFESVALRSQLGELRKQLIGARSESKAASEAQGELGVSTDDTADAMGGLATETKSATDALKDHVDAAKQAFDLRQSAADAEESVRDAVAAVADAQRGVADAEDDVAAARQGVADANDEVAAARRGVATAEQAVASARTQVAKAEQGVVDAQRDEVDAAEALADRQADLAQARREATGDSDDMRDALDAVAEASRTLEARQADELSTQEALTQARDDYEKTLGQLAETAAAAGDEVLSAQIRLRRAQADLAGLGSDGEAVTADDRLAAEIAVRDAQRAVQRAEREAEAARQRVEQETAAGRDGSTAVTAARDDATAATEAREEAEQSLGDAVQHVADTQTAANDRVVEAEAAVEQAVDDVNDAHQRTIDAQAAVVAARQAVRDAEQGVADANGRAREAIDGVAAAEQKVVDAQAAVVAARQAVRDAEDEVTQKILAQIQAQADLETATGDAREAIRLQVEKLRELERTLDPASPLRQNIDSYVEDLAGSLGYLQAIAALGAAPPGAVNAERGNRSARGAKGGSSSDRPGTGSKPATHNEVTINVSGNDRPSAVAERVASILTFELARVA